MSRSEMVDDTLEFIAEADRAYMRSFLNATGEEIRARMDRLQFAIDATYEVSTAGKEK